MDKDGPGLKNDSARAGKRYRMSLENLAVTENKEELKNKNKNKETPQKLTIMGICQRDDQSQLKISQWPKLERFE